MLEKELFLDSFKAVVFQFVQEINRKGIDKKVQSKLRSALNQTLRKFTDRTSPDMYSQGAKDAIDVYNKSCRTNFTPKGISYNGLGKIGKTEKGTNLVWEHTTPVNELIDTLIEQGSLEDVENALNNYSGVCLITREEDDRLNANGYKDKRPGGWKKCYGKVGITVSYNVNNINIVN